LATVFDFEDEVNETLRMDSSVSLTTAPANIHIASIEQCSGSDFVVC